MNCGPPLMRGELLAVEHEVDGQHRAGRSGPGLAVVGDVGDLRVREHRDVELGGLLASVSNQRLGVIRGMAAAPVVWAVLS